MYGLGWLVVLIIPMLAVVQVISAKIGAVTRNGLEADARKYYGRGVAFVMLLAVLSVSFVTLTADLEGGGAALQVLTGIDYRWWILPIALFALVTLIFGNFARVKSILLVLPLIFFGYPISAVLAHPNWHAVLVATFIPHLQHTKEYATGAIALLGTTLTSYAYVWQTIETAKERPPLRRLGLVELDATLGTIVAGISFWAILIGTGATLGVHHVNVDTADQAARALEPLAGKYASLLFGVGLLGSALIAVPVLAATSAYVVSDMLGWHASIDTPWWRGRKFYGTMTLVTMLAATAGLLGASPIKVLLIGSIIGGFGTPVTLVILLLLGRNKSAMGTHQISIPLTIAGWCVVAVVSAAALLYLVSLLRPG